MRLVYLFTLLLGTSFCVSCSAAQPTYVRIKECTKKVPGYILTELSTQIEADIQFDKERMSEIGMDRLRSGLMNVGIHTLRCAAEQLVDAIFRRRDVVGPTPFNLKAEDLVKRLRELDK